MPLSRRTSKDFVYVSILEKEGPLSVIELTKLAHENHVFRDVELVAVEQDVKRFTKHYEALKVLTRKNGKLHWMPFQTPPSPTSQLAQNAPSVLNAEGFLTLRAGVKCDHCGHTIDLTKAEMKWRPKSRYLALALHVHHIFRVSCDKCGWVGRYDTRKDVRPILH